MKYTFLDLKKAQIQESKIRQTIYTIEQELINQSPLKIGDTVKVISKPSDKPFQQAGNAICGKRSKISDVRLCGDHYSYTLAWRDAKGLLWCFTADELKFIRKAK